MREKPGNFGGFHLVNVDDTIEIESEQLLNDINDLKVKPVLETDEDGMGMPVRVYIFHGVGVHSILFEVHIEFQGREESHLHIPPDALDGFKKMYSDIVSRTESL